MSGNLNQQDVFSAANDYWQTPADWSFAALPATNEDAFVGAGATGAAKAQSYSNVTVNSIAVNSASSLSIEYGTTFNAVNGTVLNASDTTPLGTGNAGVINIVDDSTLSIGNAFVNSGTINFGISSLVDAGNLSLSGDVTLSGGGKLVLGFQQGAAGTLGHITGAGLINVDNTVTGAGNITLATLDNKAGGTFIASQQFLDDLIFDVGQMTNEGAFEVAANAFLQLGVDGQTRSMTNSGAIKVGYEGGAAGSNAQLLFAGNFTLGGGGAIDMMGANSVIASDGKAATTFLNQSAIVATQSGQIGDANLGYGVDDLTFINAGTTTATGAGVVLTIDDGGKTVSDTGVFQALSGGALLFNSKVNVAGADASQAGTIVAGDGGIVQIASTIANTTFPASTAGGVIVDAGGVLDVLDDGLVTAPVTIFGASGATPGGVVNVGLGGKITGSITFATAGGTLNLANQTAAVNVNADSALISLSSAQAVVTGGGNVVNILGGAGNAATIGGNASSALDLVNGSGGTITVQANSRVQLTGNGNHVSVGAGARFIASGASNVVTGSNSVFVVGGTGGASGADTLNGSNNRIVGSGVANFSIVGDNNNVHTVAGSTMSVSGANERLIGAGFQVTGANSANFWVGGNGVNGVADTANASNATVVVGCRSNAIVNGSNDTVLALGYSAATVNGANNNVHGGYNAVVTVGGNGAAGVANTVTGQHMTAIVLASSNAALACYGSTETFGDNSNITVTRSLNTITAGNSDTITIAGGASNTMLLGQNDVIAAGGSGTVYEVGGAVGATTISNFANAPLGVVDLLNGVGGFATASDAYNALTSDGAGGVKLSLGAAGSIDFAGASASSLSAANFKIG